VSSGADVGSADLAAALEQRIARLEAKEGAPPRPPDPKRRDKWDILQLLIPLVTPVVVGVVGFGLKDSFDRSLRREELQLSNVREMRQLLVDIQAEAVTPESAQATALTIAAFGRPAIGPLVTVLATGDEIRRPAAERALRALGLTDAEAVCRPLVGIVDNRNGRYTWLTHLSAWRLAGDLECGGARAALGRYQALLTSVASPDQLARLEPVFDPSVPADMDSVGQLRAELDRAQRRMGP